MSRARRRRRLLVLALTVLVASAGVGAVVLVERGATRHAVVAPARPRPLPRLQQPLPPRSERSDLRARAAVAEAGAAAEQRAVARLRARGLPLYCGGSGRRYVALTFDDGPGPASGRILGLLRRYQARATFFLVGNRIRFWPRLPAWEAALGALGDHSWDHAKLTRLRPRALGAELLGAKLVIERASHQRVLLFRPPYGAHNRAVDGRVRAAGMLEVLWSVDASDYLLKRSTRRVVALIDSHLRPGAIVLLHDIHPRTYQLLRLLLPQLRRRHLLAVSVPQLLQLDPPSAAQLRLGLAGCAGRSDLRRGE